MDHVINLRTGPKQVKQTQKLQDITHIQESNSSDVRIIVPAVTEKKKNWQAVPLFLGIPIVLLINLLAVYGEGKSVLSHVASSAYEGYEELFRGTKSLFASDINTAEAAFTKARKTFDKTLSTLWFLKDNGKFIRLQKSAVETASSIIKTGQILAEVGETLPDLQQNLTKLIDSFISQNNAVHLERVTETEFVKELNKFFEINQKMLQLLLDAKKEVANIDPIFVPAEYKEQVSLLKDGVEKLFQFAQNIEQNRAEIKTLLGVDKPHSYLILLQNNAESRPTGGFIGSYLLVEIHQGFITNLLFEDVYARDGQMKEVIEPPDEIKSLTNGWYLRDSNSWPDFAVSGEKAAWFLEKEQGPHVDTVIAVNQTLLVPLLEITGPMEAEGLDKPLTAQNYDTVLQYMVEAKLTGEKEPKKIFKSFIPELQKKLFSKDSADKALNILIEEAQQKNILFYSRDSALQNLFESFRISGKMRSLSQKEDYLNITVVNIGGNKSDKFIMQNVIHETFIDDDGSILNQLTISRKHTWNNSTLRKIKKQIHEQGWDNISDVIIDILGRGKNVAVIRVYVPKGAELRDAVGVQKEEVQTKYDEKLDKTYFSFISTSLPGEEKVISIHYFLPFKLNLEPVDTYKLFYETQPGFISENHFLKRLLHNARLKNLKSYPKNIYPDDFGGLNFETDEKMDVYVSAIYKK